MSKVILITGASSGFGRLVARRLAKKHQVIATMRDVKKADYLLEDLNDDLKANIHIYPLDVTKPETIQKTMQDAEKHFGHIDVLINNAGYAQAGFFEDLSDQECRDQMETNFFGVLAVTREALPLLRKSTAARIINLSSIAGRTGLPFLSMYNASKWALEGFSEALAYELSLFKIKVILIQPGRFQTDIFTRNAYVAEGFSRFDSPFAFLRPMIDKKLGQTATKSKGNPNKVAALIEHAATCKYPKLRYLIGLDAKRRVWLRRLIPPRLKMWGLYTLMKSKFESLR